MKLWTLVENTAPEGLRGEHGLSLYLEACGHRILFDAGQSGAFGENARAMGVSLAEADMAVLSHGHYDHGGGLGRFLEENETAPVYMSPYAFAPHFNASGNEIGLDPALENSSRIRFAREVHPLAEGLTLYSCNDWARPYGQDAAGLTVLEHGAYRPDSFRHEQYLLVEEAGKRILISGCSHKGVLNLVHWFRPDVLVGGFHFMNLEPNSEAVTEAAQRLLAYGAMYYTCHCTGLAQYRKMKEILGDRLSYLSTGTVIEL